MKINLRDAIEELGNEAKNLEDMQNHLHKLMVNGEDIYGIEEQARWLVHFGARWLDSARELADDLMDHFDLRHWSE